MAYIIWAIRLW